MKLLVTGGAGYIGSVVVRQLLDAGNTVEVVDNLSTGHSSVLPDEVTLHEIDLQDIRRVLTPEAGFDGVFHFAAKIAASESIERPDLYWNTNVGGSLALLDAIRLAGVPRLVFSSTAAVYGNPTTVPITEAAPPAPTNPYGWTKLAVDMAIAHNCVAYGLGAMSLRYFNVAGASIGPVMLGERHEPETHLIPIALEVAAGLRPHVRIFGGNYPTRDGTCVRDYIHVEDLAAAHLLALEAVEPARHQVYNLGNGKGFSNLQIVEVVRAVTGAPVPVAPAPRRAGDPATLIASANRARADLGWVAAKPDLPSIVHDAWTFFQARHTANSAG